MVSFRLDEEQQEIQELVRKFAQNEIALHAEQWDEEHTFPRHIFEGMAEMGLTGLLVPEEFGGSQLSRLTGTLIYEQLAQADMSTAVWLSVHNMVAGLIARFGNEQQHQRWLPNMTAGKALGAFSLSEAHAGSDAANVRCLARLDGDTYVVNGSKYWVTSAGEAGIYAVMVRTDPDDAGARGITTLIVEKDTPGFSIGKVERKMGMHSSPTGELIFEDCRVPVENRLGAEGDGFKIALSSLEGGRVNIGASATGAAQAALDVACRYAQERTAFDKPLGAFEGIQFMLADMAMKVEAARLLVHYAACTMDDGEPAAKYAAMAKCFATDAAMQVTTDAVQVLGGAGYVRDWPVERYMRDVKATQIFEGSNQIQRLVIAKTLLGSVASL
ncbi:MAG TPA: acyl-CoA dehydrogenase family protein [Ktedonobacterales bacterium]|jgi:alkylation response protein AidB-like acyl-CoA dehydrogenase|nr:acyl-CoA dehydrogenase family protein [Ktedonobacterales bacterium]